MAKKIRFDGTANPLVRKLLEAMAAANGAVCGGGIEAAKQGIEILAELADQVAPDSPEKDAILTAAKNLKAAFAGKKISRLHFNRYAEAIMKAAEILTEDKGNTKN
jgi:late competence protein required for DNA uptake (superfamily II DNA/RNA helicase)